MNEKPVRIELTPAQRRTAAQGYVELTPAQVRTARAALSGQMGRGIIRTDAPRCACGCGLTLKTAMRRHPDRATEAK